MRRVIDIVIPAAVICLTLLLTAIAVAGAGKVRSAQRCTRIEVKVLDSAYNKFLDREDILKVINRDLGGQLNRLRDCVRISRVEEILHNEGYLETGNAYFTDNGILHIDVTQKTPVLKIKDCKGGIRYVERHGQSFEVSNDWCSTLPVICGEIPLADREWMEAVSGAAVWINGDCRWKDAIETIVSDSNGELTVTLTGHDEKFKLGKPTGIKDKFARMGRYLNDIAPTLPDDRRYKEINVKYNGQVVCK